MIQLDASYEMAKLRQHDLVAIARPAVRTRPNPSSSFPVRTALAAVVRAVGSLMVQRPLRTPQVQA